MGKKVLGVIGHTGMVGSEVYTYFKSKKYSVLGLSVDRREGFSNSSWDEINNKCDIIFVCVPTPYNFRKKSPDFSIVENVLNKITGRKIVVIKSTVWPGFSNKMKNKYPKLKIVFNPEFLSRKTAKKDFENPDRQIVGYTGNSKKNAETVLKLLPKGKYSKIVKSDEAELIKYAHNVFGSIAIIYANHLYEVSEKLKIDYNQIKDGFTASEFIGKGISRYMNVFHNDKRGFGGPCFPKDVNSYIKFCKSIGVDAELPIAAWKADVRILDEQNISIEKSVNY